MREPKPLGCKRQFSESREAEKGQKTIKPCLVIDQTLFDRGGMKRNQIEGLAVVMILCVSFATAIWFYVFAIPSKNVKPWGNVPDSDLARIIALQERVENADKDALRGTQLVADDSFFTGSFYFLRALVKLPHRSVARPRKAAYQKQFRKSFAKAFGFQ